MVESVYHSEMAEIIEFIESVADPLNTFNLFLSLVSIFINILHLLILTRPAMKSSSTNVIMIGIAVMDICILSLTVVKHASLVDIENNECVSSNSLFKVHFDLLVWGLQDYFRRCSTWLGLLMAMIRTMIVKNMLGTQNPCLTKQRCGWLVIFIIVVLASILSIFWNFRFRIVENRPDNMPISCEEFQNIHSPPKYTLNLIGLFTMNEKIVSRVYLMVDAILSKFIPCILFPILTILLIRALHRAKKARSHSKMFNQNDHTTKLVIFMTVAFFVAEAPLGVIYMINAFYHTNDGLIIASVDVIIVFACLLTINSTCHFFFCIALSRQYRSTIYYTFRLDRLVMSNVVQNAETRNMSSIAAPSIRLISVH
ncbi:unnamed protein product [Caenorhabditis brenneri]